MKKIGLFGGTFSPVHFGHLNLAIELMEKGGLDQVWWIPTSRSPFREETGEATPTQRLKMVELAIEPLSQFKLLDLEINRPAPAYTIDTVEEILSQHPDKQFSLLLSSDILTRFMEWKEPLALCQKIPLLIGGRGGLETPKIPTEIQGFVEGKIVPTTQFEISGTQIRERLKKRVFVGHLLPAKVLDFIYVNQLYFTA